MFNPSAIEFIELFVISNITSFVLVIGFGILILAVGGTIAYFGHYTYSFPVINHPDGSFMIGYMAPDYQLPFYTFRGDSECNMTFPGGWRISSDKEYLNDYHPGRMYPNGTNGYRLIYKESLWNASTKEYVVFDRLPPHSNPDLFGIIPSDSPGAPQANYNQA